MYLLDSNILIGHLNGDQKTKNWIKEKIVDDSLCISTVSKIEILSFPGLSGNDLDEAEKFVNLFHEIGIWGNVVSLASGLRRNLNLSLADSIITATSISHRKILVTNDKTLIKRIKNLVETLSP